jgi:uncharacterized damage-inducible protein DinB
MRDFISSVTAEYLRYKALGEAAIEQLDDADLSRASSGDNSVATLVWHVAGNFESRFSEFRTSDGEKPWRHRDDEFIPRDATRTQLLEKWNRGWDAVLATLAALADADLNQTVTVRNQPLRIHEALHRSLAHASYHVGQIVYVAKSIRGDRWRCLSIPLGASSAFNVKLGMDPSIAQKP